MHTTWEAQEVKIIGCHCCITDGLFGGTIEVRLHQHTISMMSNLECCACIKASKLGIKTSVHDWHATTFRLTTRTTPAYYYQYVPHPIASLHQLTTIGGTWVGAAEPSLPPIVLLPHYKNTGIESATVILTSLEGNISISVAL